MGARSKKALRRIWTALLCLLTMALAQPYFFRRSPGALAQMAAGLTWVIMESKLITLEGTLIG